MKIRTQFILSVLVFGILIIAMSASAIIIQQKVNRIVNQENIINNVSRETNDLSYLGNNYIIYQESQQLSAWQNEYTVFSNDVTKLQGNTAEEKSLIGNIQADVPQLKSVFDSVVSGLGNQSLNPGGTIDNTIFQISWGRMSVQNQELESDSANLSHLFDTQANRTRQVSIIILIALIALFGVYFLLNYLMIERRTLKSIAKLQAGTVAIGAGNLDYKLEEKEHNEIGELSHSFNLMATNLKKVTASKADLEKEIHERAKIEESLRRSEEKFRSMNFSMNEGVCLHEIIYDESGNASDYRILDINPAYEELTGLTREKTIGKKASELYGTGKPPYFDIYERVAASGQSESFETYFPPMSKHFSISAFSPQKGQFGTVFTDVTERKQMEQSLLKSRDELELRVQQRTQELAQSEEKYRTLFNSIDEGFCIIEVVFDANNKPIDYRFLEINESFEKQTGLHDAEGKLMRSLAPAHEEHWFETYGRIALTGKPERFMNDAKALNRIYDVFACRVGPAEGRRVAIVFNDITARIKAEKALEKANDELELRVLERTAELDASEEKYRRIVETANEGIWVAQPDGKTVFVNQRMAEMLGYTREELQNGCGVDFLDEGEKGIVPGTRQKLGKGSQIELQLKFRRKDGTMLWTIDNVSPLFDRQGKHVGNLSMHTDITERKRSEDIIKTTLNRFYTILSKMPLGILLVTADGLTEFANQTFCDMFDLRQSPEEVKNLTAIEVIKTIQNVYINLEKAVARITEIVNQGEIVKDEEVPLQGGRMVLRDFVPIWLGENRYGRLWIHRDITERKQMEDALKDSEAKANALIKYAPTGIYEIDYRKQRFLSINDAMSTLSGYSKEELFAIGPAAMLDDDSKKLFAARVRRQLAGEKLNDSAEYRVKKKDGTLIWVTLNIAFSSDNPDKAMVIGHDITGRVEAEKAVQESEDKFSKAFHSSPVGMVITNLADGRWVDTNNTYLKMLEYTREEVLGRTANEINLYPDPAQRIQILQTLKDEGEVRGIEVRLRAKSGRIIETLSSVNKIYLQGQACSISTIVDITASKEAENKLKETEQKFSQAFHSSPVGLVITHLPEGSWVEANDSYLKMLGYTREEVIGRTSADLNLYPDAEARNRIFRTLSENGKIYNQELRLRTKSGRIIQTLSSAEKITISGQEHTLSTNVDITDRKEAEEEVIHLASFPEYNPSPIVEVSAEGDILYANPISGLKFPSMLRGQKREFLIDFINEVNKSATLVAVKDVNVADDWYEETMAYVPSTKTYRLYAREITLRKQFEEELKQRSAELEASNKELEAFSYSVSHDLRAPLRSITGFSNVLLEDYNDELDTEAKSYLKRISDAGELMGQLMDDLLKLSRVTRSALTIERVDLSDMARKVVDELRKDEPQRKVKVTIAPDMPADGDRNLLSLVLQNLLGNAWKYSSKTAEPRIEMGTIKHKGKRAFFIRDNGVGFDMTYANKLFQPFQRLHKASEFAGTGIGLATVQRIIRRHGGEVWAEAKVGEGATFYFTLS